MSAKEKIILAVIGLMIVLIPTTSFFVSRFRTQGNAGAKAPPPKFSPLPITSPRGIPKTKSLDETAAVDDASKVTPASNDLDSSGMSLSNELPDPISGPTLSFQVNYEARPKNDQSGKVFVGFAEGKLPIINPKFLLSFVVNVAASGTYSKLSLSGLSSGSSYVAYLKGPAQIATASAFTVTPTPTNLGIMSFLTGDVNEDNVIDTSDYNIVKGLLGQTPATGAWNANNDFNKDNRINTLDLAIISKNLNKTGASGPWISTSPVKNAATKSAQIKEDNFMGGPGNNSPPPNTPPLQRQGHWFWLPPVP